MKVEKTTEDKPAKTSKPEEQKSVNKEISTQLSDTPAIQYGVGGTQSMVEILTSDSLTNEQKISILTEWFGLSKEKAEKMLR